MTDVQFRRIAAGLPRWMNPKMVLHGGEQWIRLTAVVGDGERSVELLASETADGGLESAVALLRRTALLPVLSAPI